MMEKIERRLLAAIAILIVFIAVMFGVLGMTTPGNAESVKIFDATGTPRGLNIDTAGNIGLQGGVTNSSGELTGTSVIHKFGQAPDFDTSDGFIDVWDGANDAGPTLMTYTWPTSAIITQLTSSSLSDTEPIEIQGLDANYDLVVQTITLTGRAIAELTTPLIRVFRLKNVGTSNLVGTVYVHETGTVSDGVPDTLSKIKAMITIGNNQTLMALYTIPNGYTGYMREMYASGANGTFNNTGQSIIKLFARPFGQVFQIKHVGAVNSAGTSTFEKLYLDPQKFPAKTDLIMKASTSVDASAIAAGFDLILIAD